MADWGFALLAAGMLWYWFDSLKVRERALEACRTACRREGLQLLDDTVRCVLVRAARDEAGRLRIRRAYRFEFSATGFNRREGELSMLGAELESLRLEPYET